MFGSLGGVEQIYTHIMAEQPEDNRDRTVEKPALVRSAVHVQSY